MLYTGFNEFNWSVDTYGDLFNNTGFGASATSGAANTKGSPVTLIAGASVTEDCYQIDIVFGGGSTAGAQRTFLADILIDPAGGTSWSTLIPNLLVLGPHHSFGGYHYSFPLFIKAGTSIGFQHQCNAATQALRCAIVLLGKPTRPELLKYGHKVEAIGANTTSTIGVSVTPGSSNDKGSYASLGTASNSNFYWQIGTAMADATAGTSYQYVFDLALGDATNKRLAIINSYLLNENTEDAARPNWSGAVMPYKQGIAGEEVYARCAASFTSWDSGICATAYGVS
jgi:hypothetical protein